MGKKNRASAVINYPGQQKVVASVATTASMMVFSPRDGREEHYTYPPDGRFHFTSHEDSSRSFFAPGPPFANLSYYRFALVTVPMDPSEIVRAYNPASDQTMTISAPRTRDGMLEVGVLGQQATATVVEQLKSDGALLGMFQGPRSDTTIVFRYLP